ncbi:MAG: ATP-binding protein [Bacteroidetes bacterium]|nr:ATP-binding protein [Bacteroidota bacterium]
MEEEIIKDSIFRIGSVTSVDGRAIRVSVDKAKNSSHLLYKGDLVKNVSVGSYIKIIKGFTKIIGKVEGEYTIEDKVYSNKEYSSDKEKISRTLNISLLGFFNKKEFERGIKEMPLIDNECYLLDREEFNSVHDFIRKEDEPLTIGTLTLEKGQEIQVGIDSLFASHIGIFGNTGSGKSYTLAKIYHELFKKYKDQPNFQANAKFFLLDFNGEYVNENDNIIVEKEFKQIYKLSTKANGDKFPVSTETLYEPSFWAVVLEATEKTQTPFIRRAISNSWLTERLNSNDTIISLIKSKLLLAIDKNDKELGSKIVIEFLSDIENCLPANNLSEIIDTLRENLQYWNQGNEFVYIIEPGNWKFKDDMKQYVSADIDTLEITNIAFNSLDKLKLQIVFQYYDDIIKGHANREHLSPLIKRMEKRFEDIRKVIEINDNINNQKNFTIVSLKDVNIHMRKILPLLLCKQLYDEQKEKNDETTYLNIIVDEAHNILSRDSDRESEQWKDYRLETFEEIIKEGRKFGVFLTIASQRPSDISSTIISQLHNYFLHRLINNNDILAVEKTISYLDKLSFEYLPILPTGTCILAGLTAQVPVVIDIGKIEEEHEPNNKTRSLIKNWK